MFLFLSSQIKEFARDKAWIHHCIGRQCFPDQLGVSLFGWSSNGSMYLIICFSHLFLSRLNLFLFLVSSTSTRRSDRNHSCVDCKITMNYGATDSIPSFFSSSSSSFFFLLLLLLLILLLLLLYLLILLLLLIFLPFLLFLILFSLFLFSLFLLLFFLSSSSSF